MVSSGVNYCVGRPDPGKFDSRHLLTMVDPMDETTEAVLSTSKDADQGFILEVDLDYPPELHSRPQRLSACSRKVKSHQHQMSPYQQKLIDELGVSISCEKLVPNLMNKSRYVLHYRNLQLYLSLG